MDLRQVDLNLMVILDALLDEAHVTRAAHRLNMSQPATSVALERARKMFDDRLLIRGKGGMTLTPKADRLRRRLQPVLKQIENVLELRSEALATIEQTVRVSMSDSLVAQVAPALLAQLASEAPGVDLIFVPWLGPGAAQSQLANGTVDLAVSQFPDLGPGYRCRKVSFDTYHVAMRSGHSAGENFGLEQWLAWPHVIASGHGEARSGLDRILEANGLKRRIGAVVPTFQLVLELVHNSDLLANLPAHQLGSAKSGSIEFYDPPIDIPGYDLHIAWHRRSDDDPVTAYISDFIANKFAESQPLRG